MIDQKGDEEYVFDERGRFQVTSLVRQVKDSTLALRRHRAQVDAWRADAVAEGERVRQLWEAAGRRVGSMAPTEKAEVYDLLQLRVHLTRTHPLAIRLEGVVPVEEALAQVRGDAGGSRVPSLRPLDMGRQAAGFRWCIATR